ncbi:30S ribosomal protein S12 methylthiotransferase RimO [Alienimonas chondri]|uniref:Ribosomal protein uS12 methylthiotransferase RimO n=1 Tax=Alienimonas chondri TaxID=2681879 RepID=A0ABX1VG20_9PLAN|nr:30S ribosomal protein S12 methylthiotransferase RimO [Alienimonas chondri]NNJ26981.1 Ribosomal protein S12 methylthiotransferase RimO [Alienimonas chondri]
MKNSLPILADPAAPTLPTSRPAVGPGGEEAKGTYAFVSLGCPKNLVDSESMLGKLAAGGYALVPDPDGADFVVVNTCGFIGPSREESKSVVQEMLDLKTAGRTGGVVVAGCLPGRVGAEQVRKDLPGVDHVMNVFGRDEIGTVADRLTTNLQGSRRRGVSPITEQRDVFRPAAIRALDDTARLRITPDHFAYLKISEGCDRTCTFCSIPMMRGKHVTKPIEQVVAEARELAADGVKELIIVAQDTTYYGLDLYGEVRLAALLRELEQVEGLEWIRLMYLYPIHFTDELIDVIAGSSKVLPYLDMPLQHISDRVLKRMTRRTNRAKTEALVGKLRDRIPNLVLRTTMLVGFPGETEAEFQELVDFIVDWKFERLGAFPFSPEPGTPSMKLDGHLPPEVSQQRVDALMAAQQPAAFDFADSLVGYELDVLIDSENDDGSYEGRTFADAPEIDGSVRVTIPAEVDAELELGAFIPCELTARDGYDWLATAALLDDDEPDDD